MEQRVYYLFSSGSERLYINYICMYNMCNQTTYMEREGKKKACKYKMLIIGEYGRKGYKVSLYGS